MVISLCLIGKEKQLQGCQIVSDDRIWKEDLSHSRRYRPQRKVELAPKGSDDQDQDHLPLHCLICGLARRREISWKKATQRGQRRGSSALANERTIKLYELDVAQEFAKTLHSIGWWQGAKGCT